MSPPVPGSAKRGNSLAIVALQLVAVSILLACVPGF